jgi:hypothetical protein
MPVLASMEQWKQKIIFPFDEWLNKWLNGPKIIL